MRVVDSNAIEYEKPGTRHREGDIRFKYLLRGEAGSPQNYEFLLAHTGGGFPSPPHHHNFDQIRFCLSGTFGDGKGTDVCAGQCGYYPEGAWYSIDSRESEVILLQFGGASGSGFTHFPQLFQAYAELSKVGEFRNGRYYCRGENGRTPEANMQDGYEALWQHINGRPVVYPAPRYTKPIIMNPAAYAWCEIENAVATKVLGVFTECSIEVGLLRVSARAAGRLQARSAPRLTYVLSGNGSIDGVAWGPGMSAEIAAGETPSIEANTEIVMFYSMLPVFDRAAAPVAGVAA